LFWPALRPANNATGYAGEYDVREYVREPTCCSHPERSAMLVYLDNSENIEDPNENPGEVAELPAVGGAHDRDVRGPRSFTDGRTTLIFVDADQHDWREDVPRPDREPQRRRDHRHDSEATSTRSSSRAIEISLRTRCRPSGRRTHVPRRYQIKPLLKLFSRTFHSPPSRHTDQEPYLVVPTR
jgi:hypothetical protein